MLQRLIFDVVVFVSLTVMPFWFTIALALFGALYFARWFEIVGFGLLADMLYAQGIAPWFGIIFPTALASFVLFVLVEFLRVVIRESR